MASASLLSMLSNFRSLTKITGLLLALLVGGCSMFRSDEPAAPAKKGWSLWPWAGSQTVDATPYIEYQRIRSEAQGGQYTLKAHNSHPTKTIVGQMRTTMETAPGSMKFDNQSFTLGPNEEKKLLVYPARFPLTYEVTATFRP